MNTTCLLISIFVALSSVFALSDSSENRGSRKSRNSKSPEKACELELQKIIYNPSRDGEIGDEYVEIEEKLRIATPLLFTPENASVYWNLEQTYDIRIQVFDGFNHGWIYEVHPFPTVIYVQMEPKGASYAHSVTNFGGFSYNEVTQEDKYTFNIRNNVGQILVITYSPYNENIVK